MHFIRLEKQNWISCYITFFYKILQILWNFLQIFKKRKMDRERERESFSVNLLNYPQWAMGRGFVDEEAEPKGDVWITQLAFIITFVAFMLPSAPQNLTSNLLSNILYNNSINLICIFINQIKIKFSQKYIFWSRNIQILFRIKLN